MRRRTRRWGSRRGATRWPAWVADKAKRLAKIREAKAALEAEARDAAARAAQTRAPKRPGPKPKPPADVPADKAQRNFTDPESRILKTKDGFIQGYNAQAAVDAKRQIIVAHALTDSTSDQGQLEPLIDAIEANLGRRPQGDIGGRRLLLEGEPGGRR